MANKGILFFECLSGISGDMTIAALLDLGIDREKFLGEMKKIPLAGYSLEITKGAKSGISGTDFKVVIEGEDRGVGDEHAHDHNHLHNHTHKHEHGKGHHHHHGHHPEHSHSEKHVHNHSHGHNHGGAHEHRNFADIKKIIAELPHSEEVKRLSLEMFGHIARAEAKVHGKEIDEVHFHEVGAVDSIVDIIGTAIAIEMVKDKFDVDTFYSAPIHLGTGFVRCAHGKIPVPVPATTEILTGVPVYSTGVRGELVTPTGAAIVKSLASDFGPMPAMAIEKIGYGLGKSDFEIANVLRVYLGRVKKKVNH